MLIEAISMLWQIICFLFLLILAVILFTVLIVIFCAVISEIMNRSGKRNHEKS